MILNTTKSKTMYCSKGNLEEELKVTLKDSRLEQVEQYTYLGVTISKNGKIEEEINNRISKANNIFYQLNKKSAKNRENATL